MNILFRKARQKLIENNRVSKYLLYALGEIILVTIGILLALYFNNLSSNSVDNKKETWYLENILEDIRYQTERLDEMTVSYKKSISIAESILSDYKNNNSFTEIDSLNLKFNILMEFEQFPNINNTYKELTSSGQLHLVENKDLTAIIIGYYLYTEDNAKYFKNNIDNILYTQVFPTLNSVVEINPNEIFKTIKESENQKNKISDYINLKLESPEIKLALLNAIKLKIIIQKKHLDAVKETRKYGIDVSNLLLDELEIKE